MSFISFQASGPLRLLLSPRPTTLLGSVFQSHFRHDCRHCSFNPHEEAYEARPLTFPQGPQCL